MPQYQPYNSEHYSQRQHPKEGSTAHLECEEHHSPRAQIAGNAHVLKSDTVGQNTEFGGAVGNKEEAENDGGQEGGPHKAGDRRSARRGGWAALLGKSEIPHLKSEKTQQDETDHDIDQPAPHEASRPRRAGEFLVAEEGVVEQVA